jgi:hypothetical protein
MSLKPNWTISHPAVPGIPDSRYVVPRVRINGQDQDMGHGMKIPQEFLPDQLAGGLSPAQAVEAVVASLVTAPVPPAVLDNPQVPTVHTGENTMYMGEPDVWIIITTPQGPFKVPGYAIV